MNPNMKTVTGRFKKKIKIPKEWEFMTLGSISDIKRGASPRPIADSKYFGDGRGWVRIADVTKSGKYLEKTEQYLSPLGESKSVAVNYGDVIMSIAATIGKPIIVKMKACIHDGFVVFANLDKDMDSEFLYYLLLKTENEFKSLGQHGTQINLNIDLVSSAKFSKPSLPEQQKIGSILSNIDELIQKQQQVIEQTQKLKKGQTQKLFSQGLDHDKPKEIQIKPRFIKYKIPTKWNVSDLKSVSKKIADIDHKMPNKTNFGVKFIAANNLNDDEIDFKNAELISESDYLKQSKKFNAEKNDILISRIGSIGVARKIRTNERFIASYSVALIKPKESIDSEFLHYYLNSTLPQKVMTAYTIVSGNVNLVLGALEKVPVLLPPTIEEQKKIGSILRNLDLLIQQEKQYKEKLEKIKRGLMQQLLTGQTRVKI